MMNVGIVGFAEEGQATLRYLQKYGVRSTEYDEEIGQSLVEITVCDQNPELVVPNGVDAQLGDEYLRDIGRFDLIFRTPGLHPNKIMAANPGLEAAGKITTMTNEFFRVCPSRNIIGITGTKGKGTTTTLTARMLEQAGERVHVGGNIGTPALDLLPDIRENDWIVLELSSFQLFDIHYSPRIGVCLMIAPDHLDWHADMEEYVTAKSNVFGFQDESGIAIYNADNAYASRIVETSPGRRMSYATMGEADIRVGDNAIYAADQNVIDISDIGLRGPHNRENVCAATGAAIAALREVRGSGDCPDIHLPPDVQQHLATAIRDFHGLEHRLEYVATRDGVSFYNDSFSTNPMPTIAAIQSFSESEVLILGGSSKGAEFDELAREITEANVKHVVLVGDEAVRIQAALDGAGFWQYSRGGDSMTDIVEEALGHAENGDVVLLSPACASFGMFESYKDRGVQFKQAVHKTEKRDTQARE